MAAIISYIVLLIRTLINPFTLIAIIAALAFVYRPFWLLYTLVLCNQLLETIIHEKKIYLFGHQSFSLDNLLFLALIFLFILIKVREKDIVITSFTFSIFLLFFPYVMVLLFAQTNILSELLISLKIFFQHFVLFIVIANFLYRREKHIKTVIIVTLVSGSLHAFYATFQGMGLIGVLPSSTYLMRLGGGGMRVVGFFDNPNTLCKYLAIVIIILLSFRFIYRRKIVLFLFPFFGLALIFSLSREGLFGLIFSMIVSSVILRRSKKELCAILLGLVFIGVIGMRFYLPFHSRFIAIYHFDKSQNIVEVRDASYVGRIESWKIATAIVSKHPFGTSRYEYKYGVDNMYLRLLVDGGFIALACLLLGLLIILYKSGRLYFNSGNSLTQDTAICVFRITLAIVVFSMASDALASVPIVFTYILLLASLAALTKRTRW